MRRFKISYFILKEKLNEKIFFQKLHFSLQNGQLSPNLPVFFTQ